MRTGILFSILFLIAIEFSIAQVQRTDSLTEKKDSTSRNWSFSAEVDYYAYPYARDVFTAIATADRKILHLEARYNYEDRNTASLFAGLNFGFGNKLRLELTPMAGVIFGNSHGIAPGLEADLSRRFLELSAQSEYLVGLAGKEDDYLYTWSQLGASVFKNCTIGLVAQRTKLYQTELDLQKGGYAQYSIGKFTAGVFYFNPFSANNFFVTSIAVEF